MKKIIIFAIAFLINAPVLFAQTKAGKQDATRHTTYYTCAMHSDIVTDKPGRCPKCGMDLNLSPKEDLKTNIAKAYTCPVQADVTSNKAGTCHKCGKELNLSTKERMKAEAVKINTCTMRADATNSKLGKCPQCGMVSTVN